MKFFATLSALLLTHLSATAAILIFDGPAPLKSYGTESNIRRNRAVVVYDTAAGQIGIINYFGGRGRGRGEQHFLGSMQIDGGTVSLNRGSITIISGVTRSAAESPDFLTKMVSFRGRNAVLNRSTDLSGPKTLTGIARTTSRLGTTLLHLEQSFSLVYQSKLSNAANFSNDSFDAAINRAAMDLEKRGFDLQRR